MKINKQKSRSIAQRIFGLAYTDADFTRIRQAVAIANKFMEKEYPHGAKFEAIVKNGKNYSV